MKTAGLGSVGASGALRHRADWICEQGIDFRSRPETLFRSAKILKQREVAGERTWRLALPIGFGPFQKGLVFIGRRAFPAPAPGKTFAAEGVSSQISDVANGSAAAASQP